MWQGPLADSGDVLVLRPSLWEEDGDATAFNFYTRYIAAAPPASTWGIAALQQSLATIDIQPIDGIGLPRKQYLLWTSPDIADYAVVGNRQDYYVNPGRDRPIGMWHNYWFDKIFVLTREKLEAELRRASAIAAPAGFITLRLRENQLGTNPLHGDYLLYLRVERMQEDHAPLLRPRLSPMRSLDVDRHASRMNCEGKALAAGPPGCWGLKRPGRAE